MVFVVECQSYAKNIRIISVLHKWLKSMAIDSATQDKIRRRSLERLAPRRTSCRYMARNTRLHDTHRPRPLVRLPNTHSAVLHSNLLSIRRAHQRRYNQLTALSFSELIGYFETTFAASVLAAITKSRSRAVDQPLVNCLKTFVAEEERHSDWWLRLNRFERA